MVVCRLNLHGDPRDWIGQFQSYMEFLVALQFLNALLRSDIDVSPAVQKKPTRKAPVLTLNKLWENLVDICSAVTTIYRKDFDWIRIVFQVQVTQILQSIRPTLRNHAIPEQWKQPVRSIVSFQIREIDQWWEICLFLSASGSVNVPKSVASRLCLHIHIELAHRKPLAAYFLVLPR